LDKARACHPAGTESHMFRPAQSFPRKVWVWVVDKASMFLCKRGERELHENLKACGYASSSTALSVSQLSSVRHQKTTTTLRARCFCRYNSTTFTGPCRSRPFTLAPVWTTGLRMGDFPEPDTSSPWAHGHAADWLTSDFLSLHTGFCRVYERFGATREVPQGFPSPPLLPITVPSAKASRT